MVSAADMLPQLTLQSIADLSAASWARVLVISASRVGERSTMKTLLLVDGPRPSPVVCRLPLVSPAGGTPAIQRIASSRSAGSAGRCSCHSTTPVEVPPRM